MSEHQEVLAKRRSPLLIAVAVLLLAVLAVAVGAFAAFAKLDGDRIARGVTVHGFDIGLMLPADAKTQLESRIADLRLTYVLGEKMVTIDPDNDGVATYDVAKAVDQAHAVGRQKAPLPAVAARLSAAMFGNSVDMPHTFDRAALRAKLEEHFADALAPAQNASFAVTFTDAGEPIVKVIAEKDGIEVNYDAVMSTTDKRLSGLSAGHVIIPTKRDRPSLEVADVEPLVPTAAAAIKAGPFSVTAKEESWSITRHTFADWVIAAPSEDADVPAVLALDHDKLSEYLTARAASVRTEPTDGAFEEKDGKVTTFVPSKDGETIDVDASIAALSTAAFMPVEGKDRSKVTLPMIAVRPNVPSEATNPYGIKEVIGIGATNFKGSPNNRIHNITIGAASVNGTLIKPDEEFSMIQTLGVIDGTTGYKQELVIKDNKTMPEYGGGLCQIGSTAFRAAMESGLPITMRQNHSYRVPYYERDGEGNDIGPGKDATIYDPLPDFRFKNDTGNTILITTAISGNKLSFTFWGTKDGRAAEQTRARVYNVVQPPPKKVIQTTDLKPGEERCTEHAHVGSDASFVYTVHMADGQDRVKEFVSHYRPWQEVCLEGVEASALPPGVTSQELITTPDSAAADAPAPAPAPAPPTTP